MASPWALPFVCGPSQRLRRAIHWTWAVRWVGKAWPTTAGIRIVRGREQRSPEIDVDIRCPVLCYPSSLPVPGPFGAVLLVTRNSSGAKR